MHDNNSGHNKGERYLMRAGKQDRGPIEFRSRPADRQGGVMNIGVSDVVCVPPTMSICDGVETMTREGFRRLPIADAGSRKLRGIITVTDIVDFMGGGDRHNLVRNKHQGNFLSAINENLRSIMTENVMTLHTNDDMQAAVEIIVEKRHGGVPIIDNDEHVVGIVTEYDLLKSLSIEQSQLTVEDVMSYSPRVTYPDCSIAEVAKQMNKYHFRRLPVVSDDVLFGIVTATDIMKYVGSGEVFRSMQTGEVAEVTARPIRSIISGNLYTTTPQKDIHEIAREMIQKQIGAFPVTEDARLIGMITEYDLVKALAQR
ncbi:histidine kinase [Methanocalculus chunghsingensis]|uniref:Histidine kinase n=1 Tax=Methanocalculus chunghsingensis TaxID=156457 RepID=A0A8J7W5A3_9EURY|nr:CBS domain-containing protein [Methanocalculus chunghsingensis]MBR1368521.1 histidine kinase [Methanocalculus chunghsingensis]